MNLAGEDLLPDRSHVFYLEIPKEWKTQDLVHLFSSFGYVQVFWINDTSVFVALREKAFAVTVIKALQTNGSQYTITTFDGYLKKLEKEKLESTTCKPSIRPNSLLTPPNNSSLLTPRSFTTDIAAARRRDLHTATTARPAQSSGITPTMESASFANGGKGQDASSSKQKRPVSPEPTATAPTLKRSKSVVEEKKTFEEPDWE